MARSAPENGRGRVRRPRAWTVAAVALLVYVGSYFTLSRYSLWYNSGGGLQGFLYVPCSPEFLNRHYDSLESVHYALVYFYYPVWAFDHYILGGSYWGHFPMQGLDPPDMPESSRRQRG